MILDLQAATRIDALHSPESDPDAPEDGQWCSHCHDNAGFNLAYPCPTMQALGKGKE